MGLYLKTSTDQIPLATNKGWSLVGDWIQSLSDAPETYSLWDEGWAEPVETLCDELIKGVEVSPPEDPEVAHTIDRLIASLESLDPDEAVVVTNGMDEDSSSLDESVKYEAAHAPAGGVTVAGKQFTGGQFIPSEVMDRASPEERAKVGGQSSEPSLALPSSVSPITASVLNRLPRTAYERLSSRVTKVTEAPTVEAVTDAWYAGEPNPLPPGKRTPCYGFYDPATGELVTGPGGPNVDQRGVLAHEIFHALDQSEDRKYFELSGHPEFLAAYRAEISRGQLSRYATTDEVEGFAEMGRALFGSDQSHDSLEKQFPLCIAYFRKVGLL